MIEWKIYDPNNPPAVGIEYLVNVVQPYGREYICVAKSEIFNGKYRFRETMDETSVDVVTHYAEINLPLKE